ncbi:MAG TPA: hypothetical protein DDZ88_18205 [Verrucomicrobiales bacterium]|nr:hypothetical protein [Verrucomicrobiales bacterium]
MNRWLLPLALALPCIAETAPLHVVVMDPLALQLSCTCVKGTGQRRYDLLAAHLQKALGREVKLTFDESLALALQRTGGKTDLIIGKDAVVRADAAKAALQLRRLASLTDAQGLTGLRGVILVPKASQITAMRDLAGKRISLGPVEDEEAHAAAKSLLQEHKLTSRIDIHVASSMDAAALAMSDGESHAAVVSSFLPVLLEGCGKLERGSTRILGETASVPFIRVFATDAVNAELEVKITAALASVTTSPSLLEALESKSGFVSRHDDPPSGWPDWRGPERSGHVTNLPATLPSQLTPRWTLALTGPPMAGTAVSGERLIIPDKSADAKRDIFHCVDSKDGRGIWQLEYDAPGDMEYTNAPRATPVIHDGLVYLQGAHGHLHCVDLATGRVVWRRHLFADFKAEPLTWGASVSPLIVGDKLIIAPGAKDASVVALNRKTGAVIWQAPGNAAAYSAFMPATFDGVTQIIGYDSGSLGAWQPQTGARLWTLIPPDASDFNVTTPVIIGNQLLLATENNGTRLYRFDGKGRVVPEPVLKNDDLAPDTCTPAVAGQRVFATAYGELFCLDLNGLKTLWHQKDDMFHDHCHIIASDNRLLLWTANGDLLLLDATAKDFRPLAKIRPFTDKHPDSLGHPALADGRLYLRSSKELACFQFE